MNAITTKLSTKGQLILPKAIQEKLKWHPGTELVIEDTADGVLIRLAPKAKPSTLDQLVGALRYHGPAMSLEDMDAGIAQVVAERDARSRH
jgi:AbrB family looped-hinge helix DNA binding protein